LVLLGNSGAGKSLYLIQLYRQIELLREHCDDHYKRIQDFKVCFLKLNEYNISMVEKMNPLIKKKYQLDCVIQEKLNNLKQEEHMLFILDGYDEYGGKEKFSQKIFQLQKRPNVKFIISSRVYYVSQEDLHKNFSFTKENQEYGARIYYICPFDSE
jgi:hypothetical protein